MTRTLTSELGNVQSVVKSWVMLRSDGKKGTRVKAAVTVLREPYSQSASRLVKQVYVLDACFAPLHRAEEAWHAWCGCAWWLVSLWR